MTATFGRAYLVVAVLGSLLMLDVVAVTTKNLPQSSTLKDSAIGQALSIANAGDSVYAISTMIVPIFPTVVQLGLEWGSRFPSQWPLAGLAEAETSGLRQWRDKIQGSCP